MHRGVSTGLLLLIVSVTSIPITAAFAAPQLTLSYSCLPYDFSPYFMRVSIDYSAKGLPSGTYSVFVSGLNGALGGGGAGGIPVTNGVVEGEFGLYLVSNSPTQTFEFKLFQDADMDMVPDAGGILLTRTFDALEVCKPGAVQGMIDSIDEMNLDSKVSSSLVNSLNAAINALSHGNTADACNTLNDYISKVSGFANAHKLSANEAATLIQQANDAKEIIGC